ncbi:MAG: DUF2807 domain-containing protein [Betaproteobacteria bacterium]|nr:DUF2807 domain-containing protein [Betaproteobacteria bacterium]
MNLHQTLPSILLLLTASANAGEPLTLHTEHIEVPGIRRVVIETSGDLEIRPGTANRLTIEAEPHVIPQLVNTTQQDTLTLRGKGSIATSHKIRYTLEIPTLQSLIARGSGNIRIGAFQGCTFELEQAGSGEAIVQDIAYGHIALTLSGTGNIDISGRGQTLTAKITGAGNIHAENLAVKQAATRITGAGDISINASQRLNNMTSGVGNVRYKGQPQITPVITGVGTIEPTRHP